jgi:hypothetical protein
MMMKGGGQTAVGVRETATASDWNARRSSAPASSRERPHNHKKRTNITHHQLSPDHM